MNRQIQKAKNDYDLNRAAELQYGELPKLQQMLEAEEKKVKNEDLSLVHESVTEDEIAEADSMADSYSTDDPVRIHQGFGCDHPFQSRNQGSDKTDRFVPVPWTYRCR